MRVTDRTRRQADARRPHRLPAYGAAMSDSGAAGPFHVSVEADVRVRDARHVGGRSDEQLAALLTQLIQRHASEAGLELVSPDAVQVRVSSQNGGGSGVQ
jgi:hypothetical protein